uniref:Phosphoribosylformylglycinamidine synthase n=1 Tax=Cacopsylla melanoneura TaxID=428564 RepID=A0A8D8VXN4_9HEMI
MAIIRYYSKPGISPGEKTKKLKAVPKIISDIESELCYNVEISKELTASELDKLQWILNSSFACQKLSTQTNFKDNSNVIEVGPRLNFSTPFCSNVLSICQSVQLFSITRFEVSRRYKLIPRAHLSKAILTKVAESFYDRMTECVYSSPLTTFSHGIKPDPWFYVDVMSKGKVALQEVNQKLGLAFDDWDLDYYTNIFRNQLKRNPTSVECFDLAQSNSEHSRHWFFKGKMIVDSIEHDKCLFEMIMDTTKHSNNNNVIKFNDNSSSIKGYTELPTITPTNPGAPGPYTITQQDLDIIFTAETHNFPTGVSPFSGATTGTGGRIRDVQAVGRGGNCIAGTAGYCVGNLNIPGYKLPWEDEQYGYPSNFASPLNIIIEASNGASDYGNKFGEPLVLGFARSYGQHYNGARREWIKPIMFSGGIGSMKHELKDKASPSVGMEIVKVGGPVYRIGVGGGSASSVQVQGDNAAELDFDAVQRGDPEMEQKLNRVIRACIELPNNLNPIESIHDQGAGGNGNVLKEIVEPIGAVVFTETFQLGDPSISTLELWGAEYQENNALLCKPLHCKTLRMISAREKCPLQFVGVVTGDKKIVLSEDKVKYYAKPPLPLQHPVDIHMDLICGKMPQKVFHLSRTSATPHSPSIPSNMSVIEALNNVMRLVSVGSKRFLTNKVDRCVTGLIAQQQCVGPLHTPLSDVAVVALVHNDLRGAATSIGEQPIKGLVDPKRGARMAVAEALTNLVFAKISDLKDVKCSGNWMWAAKLPGEGAALFDACQAMCDVMKEFGIAVDGGKDSLSMAARVGKETVKAPGSLVISTYAPCPDIRLVVTPDLKSPRLGKGPSSLVWVNLAPGKARVGGSALSQVLAEVDGQCPDVEDAKTLVQAFNVTQKLIADGVVLSGHDISDGGLIICLLEMAFAGISGINVNICSPHHDEPLEVLFAEELGWVLEVTNEDEAFVLDLFQSASVTCSKIGVCDSFGMHSKVSVAINEQLVLSENLGTLFLIWERTSYELEKLQMNGKCADEEYNSLLGRTGPKYYHTLVQDEVIGATLSKKVISIAVLREEGINGDREMSAMAQVCGFEVWDITVQDLLENKITLDRFKGLVFPGGFSYADALGSAKGWAASLLLNESIKIQLNRFIARSDTFSFGVCNGCQLMNLLGWFNVCSQAKNDLITDVILSPNISERFECRYSTVKITQSPAIMLRNMENSVLGVWIAHGEGRFAFKNHGVYDHLERSHCLPIRYVDDSNKITEDYPMNPNGSPGGVAAICSPDGRHLAMMPHPERCYQSWQCPYPGFNPSTPTPRYTPWVLLFQNAYDWCAQQLV